MKCKQISSVRLSTINYRALQQQLNPKKIKPLINGGTREINTRINV